MTSAEHAIGLIQTAIGLLGTCNIKMTEAAPAGRAMELLLQAAGTLQKAEAKKKEEKGEMGNGTGDKQQQIDQQGADNHH